MSRDRQFRGRVAVFVLGVALAALLVGSFAPVADTGPPDDLGEVDGVAYNESLSLTVEDGFNESELDALVARSMARVEVIRGLAFEERVGVEVISREEYREQRNRDRSEAERIWENLRWEALFVVGADRDATAVLDEAFAGGVQGYYSLDEERIVIVSDADEPTVDTETLVHELVHALQDQRFGLDSDATTTDARLGRDGVVEGEAELVPELYFDRCGGAWSCVRTGEDGNGTDLAPGIRLRILAPYVQGGEFVETVQGRDGWEAVDDLHGQYPGSSAQLIHPDRYPGDVSTTVDVPDRSSEAWRRLGESRDTSAADTLGEAALYAMLVHNDVVDADEDRYEHPFSEGWAGDLLVPYERDGAFGYVWEIAWETQADAEEFAFAYRDVLDEHGAVETGDGEFVIPDGSFEGAFRLTREGSTVRIVNAPTTDALDGVHG